jgi:hypothetical protein
MSSGIVAPAFFPTTVPVESDRVTELNTLQNKLLESFDSIGLQGGTILVYKRMCPHKQAAARL